MKILKPLRGRVLCQPVLTEETLPGGVIVLTDDRRAQMTSQQAEVVAVGADVDGLQPGDWILHKDFARCFVGQDDLFTLLDDDILAKLEIG